MACEPLLKPSKPQNYLDTGFEGFEGVTRRPPVAHVSWCMDICLRSPPIGNGL